MRAIEAEQFSRLIERFYDCVLDPDLWPAALEEACGFVGAAAANIFWQDAAAKSAATFHTWNDDPAFVTLYHQTYAALNPMFPALTFVKPGVVFTGGDLVPHAEFRKTRFYKEWVRPQGFVDVLGANLQRYPTSSACFSLRRSERQGLADDEARRRVALIVPHVQRAVLIGREIDRQKAKSASLEALLDGVTAGVFLVDAGSRLDLVNDAGRKLLENGRLVTDRGGILTLRDDGANRALRLALATMDNGVPLEGHGASIALGPMDDEPEGAPCWYANILPLASGARRNAWLGYDACAAVFVRKAELPVASAIETISRRFQLTPSEVRVLQAVFEHGKVSDIATALGSSSGTVKTHLGALFSKTGTCRRADLVKAVLAHGNPLH